MAHGLSRTAARWIALSPLLIVAVFTLGLALLPVRPLTLALLEENRLVEVLTFLFLALGGVYGLFVAKRAASTDGVGAAVFYTLLSLGLIVTALEEVAWGQNFFEFQTPEFFARNNVKDEMTFHNLDGFDDHTEILRVLFGVGGLIGAWVGSRTMFRKIAPSALLIPWFAVILVLAGIDLYNDFFPISYAVDDFIFHLNEVVEMLIGIAALLYLWLNARSRSQTTTRSG